ncbi:hypothetical protein [Burkholderia sp. AW49-1]
MNVSLHDVRRPFVTANDAVWQIFEPDLPCSQIAFLLDHQDPNSSFRAFAGRALTVVSTRRRRTPDTKRRAA